MNVKNIRRLNECDECGTRFIKRLTKLEEIMWAKVC